MAFAFPAVAALMGGSAVTAGLVLTAVAEVGMAVTVVGAVTGNKKMMQVGGAMSLVGGIGAFAANAMSNAAGAAASGVAEGAAQSAVAQSGTQAAADSVANAAMEGAGSAATQGLGDAVASNSMDFAMGPASAGGQSAVAYAVEQPVVNGAASGGLVNSAMKGAGQLGSAATSAIPDPQAANNAMIASNGPAPVATPMDQIGTIRANVDMKQPASGILGKFSELGAWAEKNKTLAGMMLQVGGNAVMGAIKGDPEEERIKLERERLQLEKDRMNRGAPAPTFRPMNGGAIINGVR